MPITLTPNLYTVKNSQNVYFGDNNSANKNREEKALRRKIFCTTAIGVSTALALISKKQGFSLNFKKIFKEKPKNWAIFKIKETPDGKKPLKLEEKEILGLAAGSIAGGLAGGALFDRKNIKAKLRESVNQFLGDVAIPLTFVAIPSRIYNKHKDKVISKIPTFKNTKGSKFVKGVNTLLKSFPAIVITLGSLATGIIVGNRVSNFINEKIYHKKVDRNIKATDFAPHVDDLCLASSLMADGSAFGNIVARFIPAALLIAGNEVGRAKEN